MTDPPWLADLIGSDLPADGGRVTLGGVAYVRRDGLLRAESLTDVRQQQTGDAFGFKWAKRSSFDSPQSLARMRSWLVERYGDIADWWGEYDYPILYDAGCGAGMSAIELFGNRIREARYLGVDISTAVDVAAERFTERGLPGVFVQADLAAPPIPDGSVDVAFAEGSLHHTVSTEHALVAVARKLRTGGRFLLYVYRKKGPIREFTDDYLRERLRDLPFQDAWAQLMPITMLGKALGELNVEIDVPQPIDLLEIPSGPVSLQRLFYWHVFKAFYHQSLDLEELNHINFDWYAPANAHRQTAAEVERWCRASSLVIERQIVEQAGITVVAQKI